MNLQKSHVKVLVVTIAVLLAAILVVTGIGSAFHSNPEQLFTFTPCPGLTVTSTATTGIWNCPNEPVTSTSNMTFTQGQSVTITGAWASGYSTLGCVPQTGEPSCAVPQLAVSQGYLHSASGSWFVVQWKNSSAVQPTDGSMVTVNGLIQSITYHSNPGATYPIYHLNNQSEGSNLLQPQPNYAIVNATLG